jgi:hypothetical protein
VRSSVSVGLVAYPDDGSTIEQLVAAADVAMYEAKRRGKNRIVGYQTRTERVATDIGADTHELVQLDADEEVRTGGDPAPWAETEAEGGAHIWYGAADEPPVRGLPIEPPGRRGADRSSIHVEPDDSDQAPWWTERPPADTEPETGTDRGTSSGPRAMDGSSTDMPPEPPTRRLTAVDAPEGPAAPGSSSAPGPSAGRGSSSGSSSGATTSPASPAPGPRWLTRAGADTTRPPTTGPSTEDRDVPPSRPAADRRSSGGSSRADEIRQSGDRPWIALPIEPDDQPPPHPKS